MVTIKCFVSLPFASVLRLHEIYMSSCFDLNVIIDDSTTTRDVIICNVRLPFSIMMILTGISRVLTTKTASNSPSHASALLVAPTSPRLSMTPVQISVYSTVLDSRPCITLRPQTTQCAHALGTFARRACPSVALRLGDGKKVREVPMHPSVPECRIGERNWVRMWVLVFKPQREGGGNNLYGDKIPRFVVQLPGRGRVAWVVTGLIYALRGKGKCVCRERARPCLDGRCLGKDEWTEGAGGDH